MRLTAGSRDHIAIWQAAPASWPPGRHRRGGGVRGAGHGRRGALLAATGLLVMSGPLRAVLLVPEARVGLVLHAAVLCGS